MLAGRTFEFTPSLPNRRRHAAAKIVDVLLGVHDPTTESVYENRLNVRH